MGGRASLLCPQENVLNSFWEPALNGSRFRTAELPPVNPHHRGFSNEEPHLQQRRSQRTSEQNHPRTPPKKHKKNSPN